MIGCDITQNFKLTQNHCLLLEVWAKSGDRAKRQSSARAIHSTTRSTLHWKREYNPYMRRARVARTRDMGNTGGRGGCRSCLLLKLVEDEEDEEDERMNRKRKRKRTRASKEVGAADFEGLT